MKSILLGALFSLLVGAVEQSRFLALQPTGDRPPRGTTRASTEEYGRPPRGTTGPSTEDYGNDYPHGEPSTSPHMGPVHPGEFPEYDDELHDEEHHFPHPEVTTEQTSGFEWATSTEGCKCDHGFFWNPDTKNCQEQKGQGYECGFFPANVAPYVCVEGCLCVPPRNVVDTYDSGGQGASPSSCDCDCPTCNQPRDPQGAAGCGVNLKGEACATIKVRVLQEEHRTDDAYDTETVTQEATEEATHEANAVYNTTVEVEHTASATHTEGGLTAEAEASSSAEHEVTGTATATAEAEASADASATATAGHSATASATAPGEQTVRVCVSAEDALKDFQLGPASPLSHDEAEHISQWAEHTALERAFQKAIGGAADEADDDANALAEDEADEKAEGGAQKKAEKKAAKKAQRKAKKKAGKKAARKAERKANKKARRKAKKEARRQARNAREEPPKGVRNKARVNAEEKAKQMAEENAGEAEAAANNAANDMDKMAKNTAATAKQVVPEDGAPPPQPPKTSAEDHERNQEFSKP
eukprot:GEMP01041159.1.p1 GENE.GEMP01041159.1~~GEMP01041159.1.p1  ORF type:complete len:549 (+),score=144.99 GEMP01041159.1:58-1647(+)